MKQSRPPDECERRQRLRHDTSGSSQWQLAPEPRIASIIPQPISQGEVREIRVPDDTVFYGFLCGDHKKTMHSLMQLTGTQVSLHKGPEAFVRIEGTGAQCEHAAGRLAEKLVEFEALERYSKVEVFVPLTQKFFDFFIGPGGVNIDLIHKSISHKLREPSKNRVRITLDKEHIPPVVKVIARVVGVTRAEIEEAVNAVRARLADFERLQGHRSVVVPAGPAFQAFLLGERAARLDALEDELRVHISLRPAAPGARTREVRVTGGEAAERDRAVECVRAKLAEFRESTPAQLPLPLPSPPSQPSPPSPAPPHATSPPKCAAAARPRSAEACAPRAVGENASVVHTFGDRRQGVLHSWKEKSSQPLTTSPFNSSSFERGYGFILHDDGTQIFVHARDLQAAEGLAIGAYVEYTQVVDATKGKPQAEHVVVLTSLRTRMSEKAASPLCLAPLPAVAQKEALPSSVQRGEKLLVEQEPSASSSELVHAAAVASEEGGASVSARETALEGGGGGADLLMVRLLALREHLERCRRIAELLTRKPQALAVAWNLRFSRRSLVPDVLAQFGQLTTGVAGGTGPVQLWRNTNVTFVDALGVAEPGIDQGGLTIELHATFWCEVFKPEHALFEQGDGGRYLPRAGAPTDALEAVGRMLLKSIIDDHPTGRLLSRFVFEFLADSHERRVFPPDQPLEALRALEDFDPELAKQWRRCALEMGDENLSQLTLSLFEPSLGDGVVTRGNVAAAVVAGCRRKLLLERRAELEALRRGFTFKFNMDLALQLARMHVHVACGMCMCVCVCACV